METSSIAGILGGESVLHRQIRNSLDLFELSSEGVSKDALSHLAKFLRFTMSQMAELLPVSARTIQRKAPCDLLDRAVSERILLIAEVAARGIEAFEDEAKFRAWLKLPHAVFGLTPLELLKSSFGARMVLDELARIEHGVFS
ncbi:MAG: antitoxin Xre/MbcA/ParS toxin-binding domain-containing protein [Pseudomonadota bacterium]